MCEAAGKIAGMPYKTVGAGADDVVASVGLNSYGGREEFVYPHSPQGCGERKDKDYVAYYIGECREVSGPVEAASIQSGDGGD